MCHNWLGDVTSRFVSEGHRVLISRGFYLDFNRRIGVHYNNEHMKSGPFEAQILGGEAAMWTEWVSAENVDAKLWPRSAAIAERLWSPATRVDVESMLVRVQHLSADLELYGLQHRAGLRRVLLRIGGGQAMASLTALADALVALDLYPWKGTIDQTTPMTKFENALSGGASEEAELFALRVDRFVEHVRARQHDAALVGALAHGDETLADAAPSTGSSLAVDLAAIVRALAAWRAQGAEIVALARSAAPFLLRSMVDTARRVAQVSDSCRSLFLFFFIILFCFCETQLSIKNK